MENKIIENPEEHEYHILDTDTHGYCWNSNAEDPWYRYGKYLLCIFGGVCANGRYLTLQIVKTPYKFGENSITINKTDLENLREDFPMAEELKF